MSERAAARLAFELKIKRETNYNRAHRPCALSSFMRPLTETRVAAAAAGAAAEAMPEEERERRGDRLSCDADDADVSFADARLPGFAANGAAN